LTPPPLDAPGVLPYVLSQWTPPEREAVAVERELVEEDGAEPNAEFSAMLENV
jgi:hypothetical protein